jgi:hypothetical protein
MKLDRMMFESDDDLVEIDTDPYSDTEDLDELVDEFGMDNVQLAYYYIHRHRLYKMHILSVADLDETDIVGFTIIMEEQGLQEAEQSAKLKSDADRARSVS